MKMLVTGIALLASLSLHAADGTPTVDTEAPKENVTVDFKKVNENLAKLIQRIQEKNPALIQQANGNIEQSNLLIRRSLILSFAAKGKIFNELGLNLKISDLNLAATNLDSGTLSADMSVNGYALAKKLLSTPYRYSEKTAETVIAENLAKGKKACEQVDEVTPANVEKEGWHYLDCVTHYHLLSSKNFSEFLISVQPLAAKFSKVANDGYFEKLVSQVGKWPARAIYYAMTGNNLTVCTKNDWTCRGEYLYASLAGNTLGVSRIAGEVTVTEKKISIAISFYAIRAFTDLAVGGANRGDFDQIKTHLLTSLETLTDADIERTAADASESIGALTQELQRLGLDQ